MVGKRDKAAAKAHQALSLHIGLNAVSPSAYGGWDDVFASALSEVAEDNSVQLDVLWCFRDTDTANIERNYEKLFQRVQPAITRGRFVAYRGIDCHSIFGEIAAALPPAAVSLASTTTGELPPIVGWQEVDAAYLGALPPLTNDEIIRYFDGAVPTWRHAVSPAIPRRQDVAKLSASYAKAANDKTARSMHLIRAAGGEGKSTLLLQAAADAARAGGWSVLWRTSPKEGISPEQVASLDPVRRWLVVADDADNIVPGLADSAYALSQSGRGGVHFLLAARDADWKNARGLEQEWAEWLACYPDIVLRGISPADAKAVVTAWEKAGPDGLRELESVGNPAQRIAAFESAVRDAKIDQTEQQKLKPWEHDKPQKGSFFGGLLAVRFGQNGLQAHVRAFHQRLRNVPIENGSGSLFDALLYVAACHGTGIPGIDERVLADLVGVPRERVQSRVVRPLGEETAAVHSAGHVLTRHSHVAAAILVEAEQALGADLAEVWSQLVRQTVRTSKSGGVSHETHSKILHVGPHLQSALPKQISKAGRKAIAIAAAKASSAAEPERLSFVTDLGRTYRSADMLEQAVTTFRDNLKDAKRKVDFESNIRGYWHEWAVCEGTKNDERESALANVWLSGISLSDFLNPAPLTNRDGELKRLMISCAGLGEAFTRLCDPTAETVLARAHRAAAYLGKNAELDPKAIATFRRHHKSADKIRTGHPHSLQTAIEWFRDGILEAREEITDSFLLDLANPDDLTFKLLETTLENRRASRPPKPYPKRGNWRKKRRY